jgi:hypothetical protein
MLRAVKKEQTNGPVKEPGRRTAIDALLVCWNRIAASALSVGVERTAKVAFGASARPFSDRCAAWISPNPLEKAAVLLPVAVACQELATVCACPPIHKS